MISLQTVFDQLADGEFYSVDLGADGCKGIAIEDYPKIIRFINLALIDLYSRFNLKMGRLVIDLSEEITKYKIHSKYAQSNTDSDASTKWIADTVDNPYEDDLLAVERVYNEIGCELSLNDPADCRTISTPEYNVVECGYPYDENSLIVRYRAAPDTIEPSAKIDPNKVYVPVPTWLLQALLLFIAARLHTNLNLSGDINEGNNYTVKYEKAIMDAKAAGLDNYDKATNLKPEMRQWP